MFLIPNIKPLRTAYYTKKACYYEHILYNVIKIRLLILIIQNILYYSEFSLTCCQQAVNRPCQKRRCCLRYKIISKPLADPLVRQLF